MLTNSGIGTDTGDVQLVHGTAELSLAISAGGLLVVDPEDAGLVAVERQRLTVTFQITAGGFKIGESGFRTDVQKLHQPARRIINVNEQCARRTTILEPAMLTAINLDEFSAWAWLMYTRRPQLAGGSINRPVSSACVPSLWPDTAHEPRRASHRLKWDQNQRSVRG